MEIPCPQAPGYGNPAALYSSGNALEDPSQFTMLELLEAARRRGGADYVDQLVRDVWHTRESHTCGMRSNVQRKAPRAP